MSLHFRCGTYSVLFQSSLADAPCFLFSLSTPGSISLHPGLQIFDSSGVSPATIFISNSFFKTNVFLTSSVLASPFRGEVGEGLQSKIKVQCSFHGLVHLVQFAHWPKVPGVVADAHRQFRSDWWNGIEKRNISFGKNRIILRA